MRLRRHPRLPNWTAPDPQLSRLPLLDATMELVTALQKHPSTDANQRIELGRWERRLLQWWKAEIEPEDPHG